MSAKKIHIKGLVQGVGFRPFVYRIAVANQLKGWVENRNDGVLIQAEGDAKDIKIFIQQISTEKPPASSIISIETTDLPQQNFESFFIKKSENTSDEITEVSPDIAVCNDCLEDMKVQPHRIDYPFINCTNCGPRFTIIKDLPYDREKTTMKPFNMCKTCRKEYQNILDRRFHAQPVACNSCGPVYELVQDDKKITDFNKIIKETASLINSGKIVAIKGMGGFHLACDAHNAEAVKKLRIRKNRDGKPFAVMFSDLETLNQYLITDEASEQELRSWRSPILLLKNRQNAPEFAGDVSVGFDTTGAMLPYMPLHHLLFKEIETPVIVLTSGNISDEPIIINNENAIDHLSEVADAFLIYNRDIHNRTDDSVLMNVGGSARMIRRSRGYVPNPVRLNIEADGILATGAELVNCFCLGKGNQAMISQHIGDLKNLETLEFFEESIGRFKKLFRVTPRMVVCDMHPDYLSSRYAQTIADSEGLELVKVQHHHAHIASCMAENGLDEKVIGVSLDGVGYGDDGHIWGGEFMICSLEQYERKTHFEYVQMPGGDKATKQPWRMGLSYLYHTYGDDFRKYDLAFLNEIKDEDIDMLVWAMKGQVNSPLTSSTGRLFDAVTALCGLCTVSSFHAEAPMRLENAIDQEINDLYDFIIKETIDVKPMIRGIVNDMSNNIPVPHIAAKFHNTIVRVIFDVVSNLSQETGIKKVVLSGGSFQNRYISEHIEPLLRNGGFKVFTQNTIPANDGGIALGQLAIAAKRRILNL